MWYHDRMKQSVILASDHAGFELKEKIKAFLTEKGFDIKDVGAAEYKEGDDYPEYMVKAARLIAADMEGKLMAIIFGGSGEGEAMVANRFPGVRATVWYGGGTKDGKDIIKLSREHNNANVLSIGAWFVSEEEAKKAIEVWLGTSFGGDERHERRIEEIDSIE